MVAAVSAAMGRPFMPHQQQIVDVGLEIQSEAAGDPHPGEWAYDDVDVTIERRGGKTTIISPVAAHRARLVKRARIFMTAQNRDKARARWMDATDDLLSSPLRNDVRRKISHMFEELRWVEGGSLFVPFAPNEDGLHSETPDLVFVDELWAFSEEQRRAIQAGYVPAFATSSGQAWKFSTAGTERSAWLNSVRKAGRRAVENGVRLGTAYFESSLPDRIGGVLLNDLSDERLIQACIDHHPAVCHFPGCPGPAQKRPCPHGFTVRAAAIRSAWTSMDDRGEFLRAYGNRTAGDAADAWLALDEQAWLRQQEPTGGGIPVDAPIVLGVWVDENAEDAAVSAGFRDDQGRMHVELPHRSDTERARRVGVRWVASYVAGIAERATPRVVAIPNTGPARDVADELEAAGITVLRVGQADVTAAVSRHRSELDGRTWWHAIDADATDAARVARLRKSGGGQTWHREGEPISALGAQTMAGWGWDHAPEPAPDLGPFKIR